MKLTSTSIATAAVSALLVTCALPGAAQAGSRDADGDGIPSRWESRHGMDPRRAADAAKDFDADRLTNLKEYRLSTGLRDEDSDNDGHDDGDEVRDGLGRTDVDDDDTDDDGIEDGDEDADHDDVDNEDEDDAKEDCSGDDEDENDYGLRVGSSDSDDDGIEDGDEDDDEDGQANEDDDDSDVDDCDDDSDDDGESDEDESDLFGTITSYDDTTRILTVTSAAGFVVSAMVTDDTEIEFEDWDDDSEDSDDDSESDDSDDEGTVADLLPGTAVAELELDDDTGAFEEIEIYRTVI